MFIDKNLYEYCTERLLEYLKTIEKVGSVRSAARKLGIHKSVIDRAIISVKRKAEINGYCPERDMIHKVPSSYIVKGTSTLYDKNGSVSAQWVKTLIDKKLLAELTKLVIEDLCKEVPKLKPVKLIKGLKFEEKLVVYPLADIHLGMLSWWKETGLDYDLYIAENITRDLVTKMIDRSPSCEECLICNLGDMFHVDNLENKTERSGNVLDVDSRYSKIYSVGVKLIRYIIEYALRKHKTVRVINSIGNHDTVGSLILSIALKNIYENEPRIVIDDSPSSRHYYKYGNTLIGCTHGSDSKLVDLPLIMATELKEDWGSTDYHYWYTGHKHKDSLIELGDCKVEVFRTIAGKDAWASKQGYVSGRDLKTIIIDKSHGEIERYTFNIDFINIDKYRFDR